MITGTPKAFFNGVKISARSHFGRLGGDRISPFSASRGGRRRAREALDKGNPPLFCQREDRI